MVCSILISRSLWGKTFWTGSRSPHLASPSDKADVAVQKDVEEKWNEIPVPRSTVPALPDRLSMNYTRPGL